MELWKTQNLFRTHENSFTTTEMLLLIFQAFFTSFIHNIEKSIIRELIDQVNVSIELEWLFERAAYFLLHPK